jgi:hypothetical protein
MLTLLADWSDTQSARELLASLDLSCIQKPGIRDALPLILVEETLAEPTSPYLPGPSDAEVVGRPSIGATRTAWWLMAWGTAYLRFLWWPCSLSDAQMQTVQGRAERFREELPGILGLM